MIRLDQPLAAAADEHFHQLRLHDAVGRDDDAGGHRFDAADFVVDVDDRDVGRDEANPPYRVVLRRALVEGGEDLAVALREGGRAVHHHAEEVGERGLRRQVLRIGGAVAGVPCRHLLGDDLSNRCLAGGIG